MGAGGIYPSHPYPNENIGFNRPHFHHHGGHSSPGHIMPSYGYPPNYNMGYGRGFPRPYPPINNYGPMMNGFHQNTFSNSIGPQGLFNFPRSNTAGGLQSAPPSGTFNGNIRLNRPGEHRPHFDEQ